ncbi:OLC1v1016794C3 [Oldenlandia corymbosa var. corymbosa]|uniref:OLC1v1016794C3 n=2 Tax=Oldenlandia corymbosa var. corymbosa TaxID=529605 RepID=A0AAV1E811_OLDCO|nr:OLC1v1016794C3 [Oldenlandia corymbosa var. corymbosa]
MDPSIMKLLEEDEDETMHSGTDVEAFAAALNRDIGRHTSSDSDSIALSQGSSHVTNQVPPRWQTPQSQQNPNGIRKHVPLSAKANFKQQTSGPENQKQLYSSHKKESISSFQQKSCPDSFHPPKFEQNAIPISQTHDLEINNHGYTRTQMSKHQGQLVGLETENSPQVPLLAMHNQRAVSTRKSNQQQVAAGCGNQQATTAENRGPTVPWNLFLRVLLPQLNEFQAEQLNTLQIRFRKSEISKDVFVQQVKDIVGLKMYSTTLSQLQPQAAQHTQNVLRRPPSQPQASIQPQNFPTPSSAAQILTNSSNQREHPSFPSQNFNKPQPQPQAQHMHFSKVSFSTSGNAGGIQHRQHSKINANISVSPFNQIIHDSQTRPIPAHQAGNISQVGITSEGVNPKFDRQNSFIDQKRLPNATLTPMISNSGRPQSSVHLQSTLTKDQKTGHVKQKAPDQSNEILKSYIPASPGLLSFSSAHIDKQEAKNEFEVQSARVGYTNPASRLSSSSVSSTMPNQIKASNVGNSNIPSAAPATSFIGIGNNDQVPAKKTTVGQKKPLDALVSSPPPTSKKQKVSEASDKSVEELNDVTAVSGVDLREEEEQLFSGPKQDSRVSEASRCVVQDKLILEKVPLLQRLLKIVSKFGLKGIGSDVEQCLSLCVEERMRGLIDNLIRLSKQRLDVQKPRHKTIVNSDVRQQIMLINRKAQDEWEKKQAEAARLQMLNERAANPVVDGEKEKDDRRVKPVKVPNNDEDDRMRTTAANVAARAALGGDDMLSKWKLMAEKNKQKRALVADAASGSKPGKDMGRKLIPSKCLRDSQEAEKRGQLPLDPTSGASKNGGRNQVHLHSKVARTISVKDVITALEREPQMSKSTLMYRLYEKIGS